MSLGPYDPNAPPVVPPAVYQRTAVEVQRIREYLNMLEQRNEEGKANFDRLEREELELKKQVAQGLLAQQRLQEVERHRALLEASGSRLITNQSASATGLHGNQSPQVSLNQSTTPTYIGSQNFQQGSSIHQSSYVHSHTTNFSKHAQSRPTGHYTTPPHDSLTFDHSLPSRQYSTASVTHNQTRPIQIPSSRSRDASSHEIFSTPPVIPPRYYPSATSEAALPPVTPNHSTMHQVLPNTKQDQAQMSSHTSGKYQPRAFPVVNQFSQHPHTSDQRHSATRSTTGSSLANALGEASFEPPPAASWPRDSSTTNPVPSIIQRNSSTPMMTGHAQDLATSPLPASVASSSPAVENSQNTYVTQRSDLRTAFQKPIALPKNPTPEDILNIRKHFKQWAESTSADPANKNNHFFLFDWKVFSVRGPDQTIHIMMTSKEKTQEEKILRLTLDEFLDKFFKAVYPNRQAASPSSTALPRQSVEIKAQSTSSAPIPVQSLQGSSVTPSETTQNPSSHVPAPSVLTPSSISNTTPSKGSMISPRQANRKSLAKDLLYVLGKKRPREPSSSDAAAQPSKKHASEEVLQSSRSRESEKTHSEVSTTTQQVPASIPQFQQKYIEVSELSNNASASLEKPSSFGGNTISFSTSTVMPESTADPRLTSSISSISHPSEETLRIVEYIPKVAESANKDSSATNNSTHPAQFSSTSIPTIGQPPATIVSGSSSHTRSPSRPETKADSVIDLTSPSPLAPVASSSKLPIALSPEPLFLPSSSPESHFSTPLKSPVKSEVPILATPEPGRVSARGKVKCDVYVLVPSEPWYLVRYREQIREKIAKGISVSKQEAIVQKLKHVSRESSLPTSAPVVEDFTYSPEGQHLSLQDEEEREAVTLACTRLQETPCRWNGCDSILNSVESLIRHLNGHKPAPTQYTKSFMCRWTQCGQQVRVEDRHLERHATLPLKCAYLDCDDSFRSASQLLKHFRSKHENGILRPSYKPSPPKSLPLQPLPENGVFPVYLLVTDPVKGEAMSKERHEAVGRWVARNITTSGVQSRSRPRKVKSAKSSNQDVADAKNDYEFLTTRTTRYSTYVSTPVDLNLEDLDSANISRMIDEDGLTLWGTESGDEGDVFGRERSPPDSPLFSPRVEEIKLETEDVPSPIPFKKPRDEDGSDDDDENAAVEIMLTDMSLTA